MVSQADIAKAAGVDRTTVNKILKRRTASFSRKTVEKVFSTAENLGYDFSRTSYKHSRRSKRKAVRLEAEIEIYLSHGRLFDTGLTTIVNLAECGAMITDVVTGKGVIPLQAFTVRLRILEGPLSGLTLSGRAARITNNSQIDIGIEFEQADTGSMNRLAGFLRQ